MTYYEYEDDPNFKYCQECGQLFQKWHDDNNQYCPYCVLVNDLEYDHKNDRWQVDYSVHED
jgi:hypothetical protein